MSRCWKQVALALLMLSGCSTAKQPAATTTSGGQEEQDTRSAGIPADSNATRPTPGQLIMQARQAGTRKQGDAPDFQGSIKLLEVALEQEPNNAMAFGMIIELAHNQAAVFAQRGDGDNADSMRLKAASYLRRLRHGSEPLGGQEKKLAPAVFYHEAAVLARQEHADQAIAALKDAVACGFKDFDSLDKNSDFDPIRETPEFQEWRKQAQ